MDKEINSNTSSKLFTKEQEVFDPYFIIFLAFHSNKTYDNFNIPDSKNSKKLSKVFEKLHIKDDPQNDYNNKDEVEIQNDPNLHSEEQDELEIPDGKDFFLM
ncbi:hypothetical protein RhiirA1_523140 [Rhizophagus irregularis]|uniref:Uncharacterized protein n=1 Tax=Rhizophagus irregularis TaxID=588596 RepID=A0A2N0RFC1_9GLOM|nr:hypothetical protein RhiirA1_523140 [Rhizophagus irregularis]